MISSLDIREISQVSGGLNLDGLEPSKNVQKHVRTGDWVVVYDYKGDFVRMYRMA